MADPQRLTNGDCIAGMKRLSDGTVDLVFADPPFNIGYDYDTYDDSRADEDYLEWSKRWMSEVARVLAPTGTFWLAIGDEYAAELKVLAQRELGFTCRSWVVWYYTFGVNCTRKFSRSHAHLFHFVKNPDDFTFNHDDIRVPSARQLVYKDSRANPRGRLPDDTWILRPQDLPDGFQADQDTWYFPRVCGTFKERAGWHGCQMPEQLLGRIIRACSHPNDTVLDPFAGSGTTLIVAHKLGRKWLGFEMSADYAQQIRKRMKRVKTGDRLEGAEEPLISVPSTKDAARGRRRSKTRASESGCAGSRQGPATPALHQDRPARSRANGTRASKRLNGAPRHTTAQENEVLQAYVTACSGWSVDRVLTDPDVNNRFINRCAERGVPGSAASWNHQLIGLRKAGKLKSVPGAERTHIPIHEIDRFVFASEIAWRVLAERSGLSLDEILCDPEQAGQFDELAARLAPGWTPFNYRWGALKLRKQARVMRRHAAELPPEVAGLSFGTTARRLDHLGRIPSVAGLYVLAAGKKRLYIGSTFDLSARLHCQVQHMPAMLSALHLKNVTLEQIRIRVLQIGDAIPERQRLGLLSRFLGSYHPAGNANLEHQAFTMT